MHVGPALIPLIKIKNDSKQDKCCVKMKFRKDATAEKSDIYEFKMALFDNGDLEEFLFFYGTFK